MKKKNIKLKAKKNKKSEKPQGKKKQKRSLEAEAIIRQLRRAGKKPVSFKALHKSVKDIKGFDFVKFVDELEKLKRSGEVTEDKLGLRLVDKNSFERCVVSRLNRTYGFVRNVESGEEYFVSGKLLMGAMPGDVVLVRTFRGSGTSLEAEVVSVIEEHFTRFTGEIVSEFGRLKLVPDQLSKYAMEFDDPLGLCPREHDKVMAVITQRGTRHSEHRCELTASFGSSLKASVCALSVLELNGITPNFPPEVIYEAREVSDLRTISREAKNRLDLRDKMIFTIDGADTKDIDDAVSVERTAGGYELGVHIADVSHYVRPRTALDDEAFRRGTSVYYADRVIPMLPKELSNGICSLNPGEDRLAFSCLAKLNDNAEIVDFKFAKTVIRSRVKGVYSELNSILEGKRTKELDEKYSEVLGVLPVMCELADKLKEKRLSRGAPQLETVESVLMINEEDVCVGAKQYFTGRSQEMIEDFMLTANECAARFGTEKGLPFVYRVHEPPTAEKTEVLCDALKRLGIPFEDTGIPQPRELSALLERTKGTDLAPVLNNMVLRSMSKAKYSTEPIGHYGLVLEDYAHFTSPIRRYPDLAIHRIMSDALSGTSFPELKQRYNKFSYASADQATQTEITAMQVERSCEDCYKAEYLKEHIGELAEGIITSVTDFGFFVMLPDTCEGLVSVRSLGLGQYVYDGLMELKNTITGQRYKLGDKITIKIEAADVNSGKIDFTVADATDA